MKTFLSHYTLRGGPKDGAVIYGANRYRDLLIPDSAGGTLWYEHRAERNTATGQTRDTLVYVGRSFDGKKPPPEVTP
jgi:hypothetical protein